MLAQLLGELDCSGLASQGILPPQRAGKCHYEDKILQGGTFFLKLLGSPEFLFQVIGFTGNSGRTRLTLWSFYLLLKALFLWFYKTPH